MRNFRGKMFFEIILLLPFVLPPTVVGYFILVFFGRNGIAGSFLEKVFNFSILFHPAGAVLAASVVSLPLMVRVAQSAIASVNKDLLETAYTLGHSKLKTAIFVILPTAKRSLFAGIVLSFARCLGEFGATLMVAGNIPGRTTTMPLAIYSSASAGEWEQARTLVITLTLISTCFLLIVRAFERKAL